MNEAAGLFSAHPESLPREVVHTRKGKEEMTDTGVYGEIFVGDQTVILLSKYGLHTNADVIRFFTDAKLRGETTNWGFSKRGALCVT